MKGNQKIFEYGNPLKNVPSARMASGESELKAAACFTIDKIKDNFRNLGIYVSDDYSESFVTIPMLEKRTSPFSFSFTVKGDGIDINGTLVKNFKGKATFDKALSKSMKTVVLNFETKSEGSSINFKIYFSKKGKNSINRVFFTKKKTLQKLKQRTDNIIIGLQKGGAFDVKIQMSKEPPKLDAETKPELESKEIKPGSTIKDSKGREFIVTKKARQSDKGVEIKLQKKDSGKEFWVTKDKLENFIQTENIKNIKKLIKEGLNLLLEDAKDLKNKYPTYTIVLKTIGIDTSVCGEGEEGGEKETEDPNKIPITRDDDEKLNVTGKFKPYNDDYTGDVKNEDKNVLKKISIELESNITGRGMLLAATKNGITLSVDGKPELGFIHIVPKNPKGKDTKDIRTYKDIDVWIQPKSFMNTEKAIGGKLNLELID